MIHNIQMNQKQKHFKRQEYYSNIQEFLTKSQDSLKSSHHNKNNHLEKEKHINDIKQQTSQSKKHSTSKVDTKSLKSQHSFKLNKKTSLYSVTSSINMNDSHLDSSNHYSSNHSTLLKKIQAKIQQMNQKISEQISQSQNKMLQQYQKKLREKQDELNRLRNITNEQMIREKTIQRKEQLQRQKDNLIEGNFYYDTKLSELKRDMESLLEKRQNARKNLEIILKETGSSHQTGSNSKNNRMSQQQQSTTSKLSLKLKKSNKTSSYFSKDQFVQKVLNNYNQKSIIFKSEKSTIEKSAKQLQQSNSISQQNHSSYLPQILQKNKRITKSINPQIDTEQFYSYRQKNFDRARSIGSFQNSESIQNMNNSEIKIQKQNKNAIFFRYKNQNQNKRSQNFKQIAENIKIKGKSNKNHLSLGNKNVNISFNTKVQDPSSHSVNTQSINTADKVQLINIPKPHTVQYSKQYLQQFVIKRIRKQPQIKLLQQRKKLSVEQFTKKQKLLNEKLGKPLRIQVLFNDALKRYGMMKEKVIDGGRKQLNKSGERQEENDFNKKTQQNQQNFSFKEQINQYTLINNIQDTTHPIAQPIKFDLKKAYIKLQQRQFNKKAVIDILLDSSQFKQWVYDLIFSQIKQKKDNDNNVENIIKKFDNGFYGVNV